MKPLNECRVLVTPTSYGRNDPALISELEQAVGQVIYNTSGKPLSSEQLQTLLPGIDAYIAGLDSIDAEAIATADKVQVIARYGAGVDRVDLRAARKHGIVVTNTPGANTVSVAELAVALMLALARMIPLANIETKAGGWPRMSGSSLQSKTIGLLGFGAIGKNTAKRLQGFDCHVIAYDPYPDQVSAEELSVQLRTREQVIRQSDFLSLHLPSLPETRGMVNARFLASMKPGSFLINTARGELIVESDLLQALRNGHLQGAALDTFSVEPPGADNPLLALPQVVATPHTGAHTDGATNAMGWGALHACLAVLDGKEPPNKIV